MSSASERHNGRVLASGLFESVQAAAHAQDLGTVLGERDRCGAPDTRPRTGDYHDAVGERGLG
jgi:hypothetical protein